MTPDLEKLRRLVAADVSLSAEEVRPLLIAYDEALTLIQELRAGLSDLNLVCLTLPWRDHADLANIIIKQKKEKVSALLDRKLSFEEGE